MSFSAGEPTNVGPAWAVTRQLGPCGQPGNVWETCCKKEGHCFNRFRSQEEKNTKQSGKKNRNQRKSTFFGWFLDGFPGQNLRKPMLNAASGMPNQPFGGMRLPHFSTSKPQLNSPSPSPAVVWSWFWSLPEQIRNGSIPMRWSRRIYTNPARNLRFTWQTTGSSMFITCSNRMAPEITNEFAEAAQSSLYTLTLW